MRSARATGSPVIHATSPAPLALRLPALVLVLLPMFYACVPEPVEPTVVRTSPEDAEAILEARGVLGANVVTVTEGVQQLHDAVVRVRFEVPRGLPQQEARSEAYAVADEVRAAVDQLVVAAGMLDAEAVASAVAGASELADLGITAVSEATADLDRLLPLASLDSRMDALVARWQERGSRSQQIEAFEAILADAGELVDDGRALDVGVCPDLQASRIRWAELVEYRTGQLLQAVIDRDGTRFDALRDRFERAPYGEDRLVADAESRPCWREHSALPAAVTDAQELGVAVVTSLGGTIEE